MTNSNSNLMAFANQHGLPSIPENNNGKGHFKTPFFGQTHRSQATTANNAAGTIPVPEHANEYTSQSAKSNAEKKPLKRTAQTNKFKRGIEDSNTPGSERVLRMKSSSNTKKGVAMVHV